MQRQHRPHHSFRGHGIRVGKVIEQQLDHIAHIDPLPCLDVVRQHLEDLIERKVWRAPKCGVADNMSIHLVVDGEPLLVHVPEDVGSIRPRGALAADDEGAGHEAR